MPVSPSPTAQAAPEPDGSKQAQNCAPNVAPDFARNCGTPASPYAHALDELIALGMDLARLVHAEAHATAQANAAARITANTPPSSPGDAAPAPGPAPSAMPDPSATFAAAFERIARCVRRTVLLAQHLAQSSKAPGLPKGHEQTRDQTRARKQLIRGVEDLITHNRQGPTAEALHREFMDRLDTPDLLESLDDDLAHRPVREIITEICEDLGVFNHPGSTTHRRTPDDLRRLEARAQGHIQTQNQTQRQTVPEPRPGPQPKTQAPNAQAGTEPDIPPELLRMATLLAGP